MGLWRKIIDKLNQSEDFKELRLSSFKDLLSGGILVKNFATKQYKFLIIIGILFIVYIDNRYHCEKNIAEEVKLKKELKDIKFQSLIISSELTKLSRRTHILELIQARNINLKESLSPPIQIVVNLNEKTKKELEEQIKVQKKLEEKIKNDTINNDETIIE